ncbi:MAG: lipoyl(octanoyl) transferase LipB [Phycisphaeraceae bacterium]
MTAETQPTSLVVQWLGRLGYAESLDQQRSVHETVEAGEPEQLLLVEHPPVITLPDRPAYHAHVLASEAQRQRLGIDLAITDRGGDVTYHGPGQLVAYPIIRLRDHGLNLGRYMRLLESVVIETLEAYGVNGFRREGATGVWVDSTRWDASLRRKNETPTKICAMGVRIRRGVTLHGLALNVATDLSHFELIVPCGLAERGVASLQSLLGERAPTLDEVGKTLAKMMTTRLREGGRSDE